MILAASFFGILGIPALLAADQFSSRLDAARRMAYRPSKIAYQSLLPAIRAAGHKPALIRGCYELAMLHRAVAEDAEALALLKEAAEASRAAGRPKDEAKAESLSGVIAFNRGDFQSALRSMERALALFNKLSDAENATSAQTRLAQIHLEEGRYLDAIQAGQAARAIAEKHAGRSWAEDALRGAPIVEAAAYKQLGREEKAVEILRALLVDASRLKPRQEAEILLQLGELCRRLGDPVKAAQMLVQAAERFDKIKAAEPKITALLQLAATQAHDLARYESAGEAFEKAQKAADWIGRRREGIYARLGRGEAQYLDGFDDRAEICWRQALWVARDAGSADGRWRALHGMGRIAERRADLGLALRLFQEAVDVLESPRARVEPPIGGPEFLPQRREAYDSLIGLLLASTEENVDGRVLNLMERSRADANAEWLMAGAHPGLKEIRAQIRVTSARRLIVRGREAKLADQELGRMAEQYIRTLPGLGGSPVVTIESVQSHLRPDTALISYWLGPAQGGYVWITPRASGRVVRPMGDDERSKIHQMILEASRPSSTNLKTLGEEVGRLLLGHKFESGIRKLFLVSDGTLTSLPFELLSEGGETLLEKYEISYLPSASYLLRAERKGRAAFPWTTQAMLLAGPVGFQPSDGSALLPQDKEWVSNARPAAEVQSIPRFLDGRSETLLGAQARRSAWNDARRIPVLHVATQATADSNVPARSRLVVAADDPQPRLEYVFLPELRQMELSHVDLATLPLVERDHSRSFGDALLAAGTRAAVTPLWKVEDQVTSDFMAQFYFFLGQGMTKAGALRAAKLKMQQSKTALSHPAYWSGFVLTGDGFEPLPKVRTWTSMLMAAAGCVLLTGFAISLLIPAKGAAEAAVTNRTDE